MAIASTKKEVNERLVSCYLVLFCVTAWTHAGRPRTCSRCFTTHVITLRLVGVKTLILSRQLLLPSLKTQLSVITWQHNDSPEGRILGCMASPISNFLLTYTHGRRYFYIGRRSSFDTPRASWEFAATKEGWRKSGAQLLPLESGRKGLRHYEANNQGRDCWKAAISSNTRKNLSGYLG